MQTKNRIFQFLIVLSFFLVVGFVQKNIIPVTRFLDDSRHVEMIFQNRALASFYLTATSKDTSALQGVFLSGKFLFPVAFQPAGNPAYVSTSPDKVTYFSTAEDYGSIGLIAHNNLAGKDFSRIASKDEISLIYGDGRIQKYMVTEVREYQALSPYSPYSSFINLADPNKTVSYRELFFDTYGVNDRLILQTCIARDNIDSWGRLFVIAVPVSTTISDPVNSLVFSTHEKSPFQNSSTLATNQIAY